MFRTLRKLFHRPETASSDAESQLANVWPFDQPENCAVITTTHVLEDGEDITFVFHDLDDEGWQFHYAGDKTPSDIMIVSLKNIVDHDPSVLELADMLPGWVASRTHRGATWMRKKNED